MEVNKDRPPRWQIHPLQIPGLDANIPLAEGPLTFGRDPGNAVHLPADRFPGVSAHHATIELVDGKPVIKDLGSKNGTLVGGRLVTERALEHGDGFELGPGGPRFMILSSLKLDKTVKMPVPDLSGRRAAHDLGTETIRKVKQELGLPEQKNVQQLVRSSSRRNLLLIVLIAVVALGGGTVAYLQYLESVKRGSEALSEIQARADDIETRMAEGQAEAEERLSGIEEQVRAQIEEQLALQRERIDASRAAWEQQKKSLEQEQARLKQRIQEMQEADEREGTVLADLREQLEATSRDLDAFNPINLEAEKLARVSEVERAVVLIETTRSFREEQTGRLLFVDRADTTPSSLNFGERGEPLTMESSGSGFCIHPDGWIVTNAHVVNPRGPRTVAFPGGFTLIPEVDLQVVFSGRALRFAARLVKMVQDDKEDLALLKIEPFEGMPFLPEPDPTLDLPPRGTDVFLIGFPLGKSALQQGDTVIASTFRGIVSRAVAEYIQVDAAVHPGASGGPLIDGQGRILGVVVGMQAVSEEASSSAIGYIIPVAKVSRIWPPPPEDQEPVEAAHSGN